MLQRDFASGFDGRCRKGALDEEECFIDATFVMAKGGGSEIGTTKRGTGMKIMAIVDRRKAIAKILVTPNPQNRPNRSASWHLKKNTFLTNAQCDAPRAYR